MKIRDDIRGSATALQIIHDTVDLSNYPAEYARDLEKAAELLRMLENGIPELIIQIANWCDEQPCIDADGDDCKPNQCFSCMAKKYINKYWSGECE